MSRAKKNKPEVVENEPVVTNEAVVADNPDVLEAPAPQSVFPVGDTKPHPSLPVDQSKDMPEFEGDAAPEYVDINDPKDANLTYAELQSRKK